MRSGERLRREKSVSSQEIIFGRKTMVKVSQENFLSNVKNKIRFIDLSKQKWEKKPSNTGSREIS